MKEYALFYRNDAAAMPAASPEQISAMMKRWMDWLDEIKSKGQLVSPGIRPERSVGKVVKANNVVTDGPYAEIKETLGGYSVVTCASMEEAIEIAKSCPVIMRGGNVEIREIIPMF
jgi:hypothetical protein